MLILSLFSLFILGNIHVHDFLEHYFSGSV